MIIIKEYIDSQNRSPYAKWFNRLNVSAAARVATTLERIQKTKTSGGMKMALSRDFKDTIKNRIEREPAFREALLKEGIECLLTGDVDTGKAILRDYINATIGFDALGTATSKSPKSLMRMFGPKGNPQARNIFEIIAHLQKQEGFHFKVHAER